MKSKVGVKSIMEEISGEVFAMTNVVEAKTKIIDHVNSKGIADDDKKLIIRSVEELKNMTAVHRYICNSLLRYEGLGVK